MLPNTRVASVFSLAVIVGCVMAGPAARVAHAAVPVVKYVPATSAFNSASPKFASAECPAGYSILGGGAVLRAPDGQVLIQAAYPFRDPGTNTSMFVVKAVEDKSGTISSWSVTAFAYCTQISLTAVVFEESLFDSSPIKAATVECPAGTRVVGMGGGVSDEFDLPPGPFLNDIPDARVVFLGFLADDDLTKVTARATELSGALGGGFDGSWKVRATASCAPAEFFDGLEHRTNADLGGGLLLGEIDSSVQIGCSLGSKQIIAAGSAMNEHDMGHWYLERFSRKSVLNVEMQAEAYRNAELGVGLINHTAAIICVDK
jgi:hypothetical protein